MKKIVWDDSLSIGIEMFDNEHKMLIKMIRTNFKFTPKINGLYQNSF